MRTFSLLRIIITIFILRSVIICGQNGCWLTQTSMSVARNLLSVVELDGTIYAIGGSSNGNTSLAVVEAYDTSSGTWSDKASLPQTLCSTCAAVLNNKIYVFGGGVAGVYGSIVKTVYEFSPDSNTWVRKSDIPIELTNATAEAVNGKIYLIGGTGAGFNFAYNSVYEYNPANDTWLEKTDMPTARFGHSSAVVDEKIYVFGGTTNNSLAGIASVESYDPLSDTWIEKLPLPFNVCLHTASVVNGLVYNFTGGDGYSFLYEFVEEYAPILDSYTMKSSIPTPRWGAGSCTIGRKVFVIGGADINNQRLTTVEEYDPALDLTDVKGQENQNDISKVFNLYQNIPNPFNPKTTINFSIPKEVRVNLVIYDILGKKVKDLKNEVMKPGYYEVEFNASALTSGVYFYRIKAGDFVQTKKMLLLK